MTPADALDQLRRFTGEIGEDVGVRRYSGTGPGRSFVEAVARARPWKSAPSELVGATVQRIRTVIMVVDPAATVPAGKVALSTLLPLRKTDRLVIRGAEVAIENIDDDTRRVQGVLIGMDIQVEG